MKRRCWLVLLLFAAGCAGSDQPRWLPRDDVRHLPEAAQQQILRYLTQYCGTADDPKVLGQPGISREHLLRGAEIYNRRCAQCHGVTGDGAGPTAKYLDPRPSDFRHGVFKFTSTPYGAKPLRADLIRTVRNGVLGTAMPSFALWPDGNLQAVVDYVLVLTHRGELEEALWLAAENDDAIDATLAKDLAQRIIDRWGAAASEVITPVSPLVAYSDQSIKLGQQAFATETGGCYRCHGPDGRGRELPGVNPDPGAPPARAADLTNGMFRGGNRPIDIYRHIYGGISGTPMPAFSLLFKEQPETIWNLVNYVEYLGGTRRRALAAEEARWRGSSEPESK